MDNRRVVVTGLGMISPLGASTQSSWTGLLEGRSGIDSITQFDMKSYPVRFGGEVPEFPVTQYLSPKEIRRMDGFIQFGLVTGIQAMQDSGLEVTEENRSRIGVAVGSGIGGISTIETCYDVLATRGPGKVSPFFVPSSVINMVAGHLSIMFGLTGPNISISTACATGTHNIGFAARLIASGDADVMLAGGSEKAISPTTMAGFGAMKALSTRNEDPSSASRPWDRDRDGFVLSDGSATLVLEDYEHAMARRAKIYCEIAGFGMSADAHHMTSPAENGAGAAQAMKNAMKDAGMEPTDIDYINAHGTSTRQGDIAETFAIKTCLGSHSADVAISSTKSMIGHALGAAGSLEAVISVLSLDNQIAPPTINLENPDPECDLDYVPNAARELKISAVLSNSFGFGGTNSTLIFKRHD
ncbi:MAG: beta-ketoacyl-ACP synthase II [Candidatus Azotimanducaceae bacterium]